MREQELDSPDFSLVLETVLSDKAKLVMDSLLFEGSSGGLEGGRVVTIVFAHKLLIFILKSI